MKVDQPNCAPFFYWLQPRAFTPDRLYRVYVSEKVLIGAYVAGQVHDEGSGATTFQQWSFFFRPLVRRWLIKRLEREALYDAFDPYGPLLLNQDRRNFRILRTDVARTRFRRNRYVWRPSNVGVVELELLSGVKRRFVIVGEQTPDTILQLMLEFDPEMEVTGKPDPLPQQKPMSPAQRRWLFSIIGVLFLIVGVLIGYRALFGVPNRPTDLGVAILNLGVAVLNFVAAWRASIAKPGPNAAAGADRSSGDDQSGGEQTTLR